MVTRCDIVKISDYIFEIPQTFRADMRVPARVFMREDMLDDLLKDRSLDQLVNVATLPGITGYALAMPDIHQGYGFPIGGVAATDITAGGVISPGGIGYDINCGVRLMTLSCTAREIKKKLEKLADGFYHAVPSGVGQGGPLELTDSELEAILQQGASWAVKQGFGETADLVFCEEGGALSGALAAHVSERARNRGRDQLGTLGSGNHFLEIQYVDEIFDAKAAEIFGIYLGAITVMVHCGSRGLGHQVCTDHVKTMVHSLDDCGFSLADPELSCAPFLSEQGQAYFSAMAAAANFAWTNRQMITHQIRSVCKKVLGEECAVRLVYDISHNMGKREMHSYHGKELDLIVHRKGATRAFGAGRSEVCDPYRSVGQPVLIPGTMGTASYVLVGEESGREISWGSSCHGAGRILSRNAAKKQVHGKNLKAFLQEQGIIIRCDSLAGLAEEAPIAYKDVESVVDIVEKVGIARRVARLKPLAVVKGG